MRKQNLILLSVISAAMLASCVGTEAKTGEMPVQPFGSSSSQTSKSESDQQKETVYMTTTSFAAGQELSSYMEPSESGDSFFKTLSMAKSDVDAFYGYDIVTDISYIEGKTPCVCIPAGTVLRKSYLTGAENIPNYSSNDPSAEKETIYMTRRSFAAGELFETYMEPSETGDAFFKTISMTKSEVDAIYGSDAVTGIAYIEGKMSCVYIPSGAVLRKSYLVEARAS